MNLDMKLTSSDVRWAYRILLGRECESDEIVEDKIGRLKNIFELRRELLTSDEYYEKSQNNYLECLSRKRCVAIKQSNGFRIHIDLSDFISMRIINDDYDLQETQFVRRATKAGDTVLDLGAHVGYYTCLLASIVGEKGKVFSFEPQKHLFSLIQQSIEENGYNDIVTAENVCVGDITKEGRIAQHQGPGDYGCTHLLNAPSALPCYDNMTVENVDVLSLVDYHFPSPIDFIKIDIEGAEYIALKPLEKRLKKDRPFILSEVNQPLLNLVSQVTSAEYINFLQDCGYKCYVLGEEYGEDIDDISISCRNVVFIPEGRQVPIRPHDVGDFENPEVTK